MLRGEDKSGAQECRTTQTKSIFRTREFSSDACRRRLRKWEVVQEAPDCEGRESKGSSVSESDEMSSGEEVMKERRTHSSRNQDDAIVTFPTDLLSDPVSSVRSIDNDIDRLRGMVFPVKLGDETEGGLGASKKTEMI